MTRKVKHLVEHLLGLVGIGNIFFLDGVTKNPQIKGSVSKCLLNIHILGGRFIFIFYMLPRSLGK